MTADRLHGLGLARLQAGDLAAALDAIGRAVQAAPEVAAYRNSLGAVLASAGDAAAGARQFRTATALAPADIGAWTNLGHALRRTTGTERVARLYARAVALDPASDAARRTLAAFLADAHNERGIHLARHGGIADALAAFEAALAADPLRADASINSALLLQRLGRQEEARRRCMRALVLEPSTAEGHANLAGIDLGELDPAAAIRRHRRALAIRPSPALHSGLIFTLCCAAGTTNDALYAECRRWEAAHGRVEPVTRAGGEIDRSPERRLRLGWCSADFSNHPVGRNVVGLFERLDRERFASVVYGDLKQPDPVTQRFVDAAEAWRETRPLGDAEVARAIAADRIDILLMMAGHTVDNRMRVAAYRPAPVQVSFHDIVTSGLAAMDAWITDATLHPEATTERFTERLVRLPCFYLHQPPAQAPEVGPPPSADTGSVTFGSMNNPHKYDVAVLDAWARILGAVPGSTLLLKYSNAYESRRIRARILARLADQGVAAERVRFVTGRIAPAEHFRVLGEVDIALDPFPFNGSTTTFEALWMGIPVVTLAGERFVGRVGASVLARAGLDDLVAADVGGYVERAIALASDPARRAQLRRTLRARVAASPLCDAAAHARSFEAALRGLWRGWCRNPR